MPSAPLMLETLVDFPDDALSTTATLTTRHLDSLMGTLAAAGIRRVLWYYYGDGRGGWLLPAGIAGQTRDRSISFDQNQWDAFGRTQTALGNPLAAAVQAAHRHGLELYANFKPYETGVSMLFPEGSPQAREWGRLPQIGGLLSWLDPFVLQHPELRLQHRPMPADAGRPITRLVLTKADAAPTRVTAEHLQLWLSDRNYRYQRYDGSFTVTEAVVPSPSEVEDIYGNRVTARGAPVRTFTLTGFALTAPYLLVTTDFATGEGDFRNAWDRLLTAYDDAGRELPGVYATGSGIWFPEWEDWRTGGLAFDTGRGPEVVALDTPNQPGAASGRESDRHFLPGQKQVQGIIAYARGRNARLPGGLCECEPAVQDFWLRCIDEMLAAGVDGVDVRVENHSCHTDFPAEYGYNPVVLATAGSADPAAVATARGAAYTAFLERAAQRVRAAGKRFRPTLNLDWFRPAESRPRRRRLAFPGEMTYPWQEWLDRGLGDDGVVLRPFASPFDGLFGSDPVAQEMIARCQRRQAPITVNRYVWRHEGLTDEYRRLAADGRFSSLVLYETWSYTRVTPAGQWRLAGPDAPPDPLEDPATAAARDQTADHVGALLRHRAAG